MPMIRTETAGAAVVDWDAVDARADSRIAEEVADDPDAAPLMDECAESAILAQRARKAAGLSQTAFAARFGLALGTVRDWEQGRHSPGHVGRALLTIIRNDPDAALKALDKQA